MQVPYASSFSVNAWTVAAWINLSATAGTANNGILGTRFNLDNTFDMKIGSNDTVLHSDIGSGSGWLNPTANASYTFQPGTWYMVAETVASSGYAIYVNGSKVATGSVGGVPLLMKSGQTMGIGEDFNTEYFNGSLQDVSVFGSALSSAQVAALYNKSYPAFGNLLPTATPLTIAAGATLDLDGTPQQVAALSGAGTLTNSITSTSAALTVGDNSSTTFSGTISDTGIAAAALTLTKVGSGTLTLAGSSTYLGPTTINQGKLLVNGALSSPVAINSGGILGGAGSLSSVTVNTSGQIAPGNPLGTLSVSGSLILSAGAVMDYELDTPSTSDEIACGNVALNGQQFGDFHFTWSASFGPGQYNLIEAGSMPSGTLGGNTSGSIDNYPATLAVQGNDLVLTVVPEPSTLALLAAAAFGLIGWAWRRKLRNAAVRWL